MEMSAGKAVNAGASLSTTVTVNAAEAVLPAPSVAMSVTVLGPIGKAVPATGLCVTAGAAVTASVTVAKPVKSGNEPVANPASVLMVWSAGAVMLGGVVSCTVAMVVAVAVFPAASVAVNVIVVSPRGRNVPDTGLDVTGTGPSTASMAVGGVKMTMAPAALVASTLKSGGMPENTGGVVSCA